MNRRLAVTLLTLLLLAASAASASAAAIPRSADSHAPAGARLDWLPSSEWVMSSWLPYDETRLHELAKTSRAELSTWLNDRRSIGDLARQNGIRSLRALAGELVAPRLRGLSAKQRRVVRDRALATLTQPHLGNHVMFHVFHTPAIASDSKRIFGVRAATFRKLRSQGMSPTRIGAVAGRNRLAVRGALRRLFRERAARAVRVGAMTQTQATALLQHQEDGLNAYVDRSFRTTAKHNTFLCTPR
jgi:hypothetical protein